MSVDEELARAVEEAEAEVSVPAVAQATGPEGPRPPAPKNKSSMGLLVGLLVIVAGALTLVFTSITGAGIYSKGVSELMKDQARYSQRAIRVSGVLVHGTLTRRDEPCEYRFKLREKDTVIE